MGMTIKIIFISGQLPCCIYVNRVLVNSSSLWKSFLQVGCLGVNDGFAIVMLWVNNSFFYSYKTFKIKCQEILSDVRSTV